MLVSLVRFQSSAPTFARDSSFPENRGLRLASQPSLAIQPSFHDPAAKVVSPELAKRAKADPQKTNLTSPVVRSPLLPVHDEEEIALGRSVGVQAGQLGLLGIHLPAQEDRPPLHTAGNIALDPFE